MKSISWKCQKQRRDFTPCRLSMAHSLLCRTLCVGSGYLQVPLSTICYPLPSPYTLPLVISSVSKRFSKLSKRYAKFDTESNWLLGSVGADSCTLVNGRGQYGKKERE